MTAIEIRPAGRADIDAVTGLLSEAAAWTASIGSPNWPSPFPREVVAAGVERRGLHVAELGSEIVAAVTFQWSDVFFWGEQPDDAG